jgi:two-component system, LytTR family, response regulator
MSLRVMVVDDEPLARRGVVKRLANHADIQVIGEYGDGEAALPAMVAESPDLVFMDVQMPGLNGLDALGLLPPQERPPTIFLTAYDRFALKAFEVHALDYLLKPIDDDRFVEALERARSMHELRQGSGFQTRLQALLEKQTPTPNFATRFMTRSGSRITFIAATEIDWIEADGDYAGLHVGGRVHLLREPLHQLATRLDPALFVRVHRSAIVRVDRIAAMEPLPNRDCTLRLHDGTSLRASRTYADKLREALAVP